MELLLGKFLPILQQSAALLLQGFTLRLERAHNLHELLEQAFLLLRPGLGGAELAPRLGRLPSDPLQLGGRRLGGLLVARAVDLALRPGRALERLSALVRRPSFSLHRGRQGRLVLKTLPLELRPESLVGLGAGCLSGRLHVAGALGRKLTHVAFILLLEASHGPPKLVSVLPALPLLSLRQVKLAL